METWNLKCENGHTARVFTCGLEVYGVGMCCVQCGAWMELGQNGYGRTVASEVEVPAETGQSPVVSPVPVAAPESGEPRVWMETQLKRR